MYKEGDLVREIAKQSGAPQIKILSEKKDKTKESIIKVMGGLSHKQEATRIILQIMEKFRLGETVLSI